MRNLFFIAVLFFFFISSCASNSALIYKNPQNFAAYKDNVSFEKDITYSSQYPNGELDIIYPKPSCRENGVIFWVHGGSYVEGDKSKPESFLVMLANNGWTIVNLNYALAPKTHYPVALKQIELAYLFIKENSGKYKINLDRVFFGGDSSGAQLVSQFANLQTNGDYLKEVNANIQDMQLNKVIERKNMAGVLLF
jgi:acetyl esterase/lipase